MKAFTYEHGYRTHDRFMSRYWLMTLQYIFLTASVVCIIVCVWYPEIWIRAAVTAAVLFIAGAVCKSGRQ